MGKFNQSASLKSVNHEGAAAFVLKNKERLTTQVLTSFLNESKYYGDNTSDLFLTASHLVEKDPKFVANLARYARKEMHLRSVAHLLTAIVAKHVPSKPYIKEVVADVVERPDDILEILACYVKLYGKPIPNGLKKALGNAMHKFNEYSFSKYSGENKEFRFRDVLRLTHVKPKDKEEEELFRRILKDELEKAKRWETELSARGNTAEVWEELIAEKKIGYMAALRNLRNMIAAQPQNIGDVYEFLGQRDRVLASKQLPFRFYSAFKAIDGLPNSSHAVDALEQAIIHSVENLPRLPGKTVIGIDISISMQWYTSGNSDLLCVDIAKLMAVIAAHMCDDVRIFIFDTKINELDFTLKKGILRSARDIFELGGGTNVALPIERMISESIYADRVLLFSDMEINRTYSGDCQRAVDTYRELFNPNLWVHAIDLQGYGTTQFYGKNTNVLAGWSERLLEYILTTEQGISTQVEAIENY